MARPLLDTKLYAPRPRPSLVNRPQLIEKLSRGTQHTLTLVSAPAGFGKTTLLAEWLAASRATQQSVGWVSLDEADNDSVSFWTYVIAALQTAVPGIGSSALAVLSASQPQSPEAGVAILLNELSALPNDIVLVVDDYHVIDAPDIHEQMTFLLERLPRNAHVVITTRVDPALSLARLRAQGELTEIRTADLRFTSEEAVTYLNDTMSLDLRVEDVARLEARTEGWIAALQLAALSLEGRRDPGQFIAEFAGDDRYIVDYLTEEVLQRQPEAVRSFLLQTSILNRLSGPLCDAVTGHDGTGRTLDALDRANLFLVPLDDRRQWYRYHHLFADVLRARLIDERPEFVDEGHRRAAAWYDAHGFRSEAIRHALAGKDFERAASLLELALPSLLQARELTTLRRWLEALPDSLLRTRPMLSVTYAGGLMANGEMADVEDYLRDAERWLETTERARVPDDDAFRHLPATIGIYRAAQAQSVGDLAAAATHARHVLDLAGDGDHFERGAASGFLALGAWTNGELEAAFGHWSEAMSSLRQAGHLVDAVGCIRPLAEIRLAQGRLAEAMRLYEQGWRLATEQDAPVLRGGGDMQVGMSSVSFELGDLSAATQHLLKSSDLGEHAGLALNPYRWRVTMARIREAEGDPQGALDLLDEAARLYVSEFHPDVRPVGAIKARIWISQGRLADATAWLRDRALAVEDDLSYLREFEHVTLARLLMARYRVDAQERWIGDAQALLGRLLTRAEAGGRTHSVIEILVLQALAHHMSGDVTGAFVPLERALTVAEPEGYVRIFTGEGKAIIPLLSAVAKAGVATGYVNQLRAHMDGPAPRTSTTQALVEPLSERELHVLRLLASDLDGPSIATELVVALSTIRSHTKSIYAKLGVSNRRAAVRRGEELGLLSRTATR